ncbi:MAG: prepilin-type N-terminal cleavage/methylation domain-containing protein [Verrucomicrobiota bacterium]
MNKPKKGFTLVEIMIVVVIIALLATMAIPAFQKIQENSERNTIMNNLEMIASNGQRYLLENGVTSVDYSALVGTYFPEIQPVAGEDYTNLTVSVDGTLTVSTDSGEISYTY